MLLGNKMSSLQTWPAFSHENDFQISGTKRFAGKGEAIGRGKKKEIAQIVRDEETTRVWSFSLRLSLPIRFPAPISVKIAPFAVRAADGRRDG